MRERNAPLTNAADWRSAARKSRASRAEPLTLPSGETILAVRPEPLEWIMSGRIPQRLLAAALGESSGPPRESGNDMKERPGNDGEAGAAMTREDVLELARFVAQLVRASVVRPAIGDGEDEIPFDDIPVEDRAFIFQWACRALNGTHSIQEDHSSPSADGLERFCEK